MQNQPFKLLTHVHSLYFTKKNQIEHHNQG